MATTTELSENSHQGFDGIKAALCLASMDAKSNTASGLQSCLRREGIGSRSTGKERDETGLDYFLARYYSGAQGRFTSPDEFTGGIVDPFFGQPISQPGPLPYADIGNPQSINKYTYVLNNPLKYTDPDGHFWDYVADAIGIGYDIYELVTDPSWGNAGTLGADIVLGIVPFVPSIGGVKAGAKVGSKIFGKADDAVDAVKVLDKADDVGDATKAGGKTFDQARREGFDHAGMTDPTDVKFTRVDPETGTVVEFKGSNGAQVGYDGPHSSPGPSHNQPHVSAQSGGKRSQGGGQRKNTPYCGDQHPCRNPDTGAVEPH